ncbi:MAG: hypothetical protein SWK76_05135 [Actinomycetota bacterium]|nr:hypothetical protein [Actinomycetota bacterium]
MFGATVAALESAVQYKGYKALTDTIVGVGRFINRKGYERVPDMIGLALPQIYNLDEFLSRFMASAAEPDTLRLVLS